MTPPPTRASRCFATCVLSRVQTSVSSRMALGLYWLGPCDGTMKPIGGDAKPG